MLHQKDIRILEDFLVANKFVLMTDYAIESFLRRNSILCSVKEAKENMEWIKEECFNRYEKPVDFPIVEPREEKICTHNQYIDALEVCFKRNAYQIMNEGIMQIFIDTYNLSGFGITLEDVKSDLIYINERHRKIREVVDENKRKYGNISKTSNRAIKSVTEKKNIEINRTREIAKEKDIKVELAPKIILTKDEDDSYLKKELIGGFVNCIKMMCDGSVWEENSESIKKNQSRIQRSIKKESTDRVLNCGQSLNTKRNDCSKTSCQVIKSVTENKNIEISRVGEITKEKEIEEKLVPKIVIDMKEFNSHFEKKSISGFINCFKILSDSGLPEEVTEKLKEITKRMEVLNDAINKFKKVYEIDMHVFMESFFPEVLRLTVNYMEYVNVRVSENILKNTQTDIVEAIGTLLIGINDKIDEIYQFAAIELKAAAKALNANMNLEGYVDFEYKI